MKKIVCVLGSPRRDGNSESIARTFIKTAEELGAVSQSFYLNGLNFKGCQACMGCKTVAEECTVKDDLYDVLAALKNADIILLASPIYFGQVSGQIKSFIDRMYAFLKPDFYTNPVPSRLESGKKCVMILTQGDPTEHSYDDVFNNYAGFFERLFSFEMHKICGFGLREKEDAMQRDTLIKITQELARELMS